MPEDPQDDIQPSFVTPNIRHSFKFERVPIARYLRFDSFAEALAFMSATVADLLNHHPEWVSVHDRGEIVLTTRDANGLSRRDATPLPNAPTILH